MEATCCYKVTKYVVEIEEVYTGRTYSLFTENTHVNFSPLHAYYIYECSVAAHTIATGVFSALINVTTKEACMMNSIVILYFHTSANWFTPQSY